MPQPRRIIYFADRWLEDTVPFSEHIDDLKARLQDNGCDSASFTRAVIHPCRCRKRAARSLIFIDVPNRQIIVSGGRLRGQAYFIVSQMECR